MRSIYLRVIVTFSLIYSKYASSQDYEDLYTKLIKLSFNNEPTDPCSQYNSFDDCECPYQNQEFVNDYSDDLYGGSNVQVLYIEPEQYKNIYDFVMKKTTTERGYSTVPSKDDASKEETTSPTLPKDVTTQETTTTPVSAEITTITTRPEKKETTTIMETTARETTTMKQEVYPVEDTINGATEIPVETKGITEVNDKTTSIVFENENKSSTSKKEDAASLTTESSEYFDYDKKDSREDVNTGKQSEKVLSEIPPEVIEEDDNSKPKDINSWLSV